MISASTTQRWASIDSVTVIKGAVSRNPKALRQLLDESQHYAVPTDSWLILREYTITELHLTLNAGKWNYDNGGILMRPELALELSYGLE
ncbi:hypothetical protein DFJ58DRAFT_858126 [Suillus subalutaceus]|uniref:uncharacterized protein n=1 Tax=Suillus subalutaceus TaxID=48586 RepID=UPI001B8823E8|nr:uncharacterized protein DFJ58DRAFT_858126 [Suillus subalutaceus]KAG1840604.1 hypothetical protein DFJ58DRAFT_858126 [Suillus subalutaceus]